MNRHRHVALAGVLLLCGAGAGQLLRAADEGNDADKRAKLELQYAQAQYDLAETNLKKVEATNQRFSKTISAAVIAEYVEDMAIAKAQLESAKQGTDPDLFTSWLRRAESNLRSAESYYKSATAANQRQPGTDQKLQWQVQILNDQVARLKEQTSRIAPQTRVYPWRY